MDDVETLYGLMEVQLQADLAAITDPVKFLTITDVALDSVVGNTAHLSVSNGLGVGQLITYEPFEEDDDWIWGTLIEPLEGKCDGSEIGVSDGSNELEFRLNNPIAQPYRVGYTDIEIVEVYYEFCYFLNPFNSYRVFNTTTAMYCLHNEELTEFLDKYDNIVYNYNDVSNDISNTVIIEGDDEGARPEDKNFISIDIEDNYKYEDAVFFHYLFITYGTPYYDLPQ
jgi:hypothetical protein